MMRLKGIFLLILLVFSILFYTFSISISSSNSTAEMKANSTEKAKNLFKDVISPKLNSPQNLKEKFVSPLLGGGLLYNLSGNQSFQAQISCPSSLKFLEIMMQPKSTGDTDFYIYYDSNFDGNLDKGLILSGVSGLCANGYIICNSGTFQNCQYYTIEYGNNSLQSKKISYSELNGCFGINNAYGSGLVWRNREYVLQTIGGVVVGAILKTHPNYAISQVGIEDVIIRYYGQDTKNCNVVQGGEGSPNPVTYYDNPYSMKVDSESRMRTSNFTSFFVNLQENLTEKSCYVRRVITEATYDFTNLVMSINSGECPGVQSVQVCGENCLRFKLPIKIQSGDYASTTLTFDMNPEVREKLERVDLTWCTDTAGCSRTGECTDDDGSIGVYVNGRQVYSWGYGDQESANRKKCDYSAPGVYHTRQIGLDYFYSGTNTVSVVIGGAGGGAGVVAGCRAVYLTLYFTSPLKGCYITQNYVEDRCGILRKDKSCSLKDKKQDGVLVVKNYQKTGLVPLMDCQTICEDTFCYDDWTIEEFYTCKTSLPNIDMTRPQHILNSTSYGGGVLTFDDIRKEKSGGYTVFPGQKLNIELGEGEACPKVCKVKVLEQEQEIGEGGPLGEKNTTYPKVRYDFRECLNEGTVCPYDSKKGEEMVSQGCACLSDINEVLVSLQTLRLIGQDIICTSGTLR